MLDTFGFVRGSESARQLEQIFEGPEALGPARVPRMSTTTPELAGRLAAEAVRRGMRAQVALTPPEGRELAVRERPDVALLDLSFDDGTSGA